MAVVLYFCLFMVACSCAYHLLVIIAAYRFRCAPQPPLEFTPPVSIFKPLHGLERDLHELLSGFCEQDYPKYEVLFAVADPGDPAVPVVLQLEKEFPTVPIRLVVADRQLGTNGKIDNLDQMFREMRYDFLAISDSDMRVGPDYLQNIMAPFRDPQVGLVTCFYRAEPGRTLASVFEALGISGEFHGSAMLARMLQGVNFAFGSTIALARETVKAIGGFAALADYQGDDYEMGHRVAALKRKVVISPYVVDTVLGDDSWRTMIQRQFRWVRSVAGSRPSGHFGLIFTYGLPFVLLALALTPHSYLAWYIAALWLSLRLSSAWMSGVIVLDDPVLRRYWFLLPARELLTVGLWIASFVHRRITWRGQRFRVEKGKMVPL